MAKRPVLPPKNMDDDEVLFLFGVDVNANTRTNLGQFASSKTQADSALEISKKKLSKQEYTIGGLPSDDWREWAASVKAKPMPVRYK